MQIAGKYQCIRAHEGPFLLSFSSFSEAQAALIATFQIYSQSEILIVLSFEREEFSWLECVTYLSIVIYLFYFF